MKLCEHCQKKPAKPKGRGLPPKYCSRKCCRAAYRPQAQRLRAGRCAYCQDKPRVSGTTRCKACQLPTKVLCPCGKKVKRTSPGCRYCVACRIRVRAQRARERGQEDRRVVVPCPRCDAKISGETLAAHMRSHGVEKTEARDWYNARKKTEDILRVHEWNLGDKTMAQMDKEYFEWRCL